MNDQKIRRLARRLGLNASKFRRDGLWRFANQLNVLESPEAGLEDLEALEYLTLDDGGKPMNPKATHCNEEDKYGDAEVTEHDVQCSIEYEAWLDDTSAGSHNLSLKYED